MVAIQQDPTPDLNPDTLGALSQLMLAQAQQVFVHKAIHGKFILYTNRTLFLSKHTKTISIYKYLKSNKKERSAINF